MDAAVQAYVEGIETANRPLFDRVHALILGAYPDVEVGIAYQMPVYRRSDRSLNVGAWKHGISLYGWDDRSASALLARHPELSSGRGTLRIPRTVADEVTDDELRELVRGVLGEESAEG